MRHLYVLYQAMRPAEENPVRCCSDEPPAVHGHDRPSTTARRVRKLRVSVPASIRVLRRSLRLPVGATGARSATRVVTRAGRHVGHVQEVAIGLDSGRALYAVATAGRAGDRDVVFVPDDAMRVEGDRAVVVLDERRLTPELREVLLAS